jgi:hypothetical protein
MSCDLDRRPGGSPTPTRSAEAISLGSRCERVRGQLYRRVGAGGDHGRFQNLSGTARSDTTVLPGLFVASSVRGSRPQQDHRAGQNGNEEANSRQRAPRSGRKLTQWPSDGSSPCAEAIQMRAPIGSANNHKPVLSTLLADSITWDNSARSRVIQRAQATGGILQESSRP